MKFSGRLVTCGCGPAFDPHKFKPVTVAPYQLKPKGGLWSSPVGSKHSWEDWCLAEDFHTELLDESFTFKLRQGTSLFVIDSVADLNNAPVVDDNISICTLDTEALIRGGYDAIWLTERGERVTRHSHPRSLYGWDCETVFVMNKYVVVADYPTTLSVSVKDGDGNGLAPNESIPNYRV